MTGASLGYSGIYVISSLNGVGSGARWHSSRVSTTGYSRFLSIDDNGLIYASDQGSKYYGRSVRCVYYLHW
ncbi:hypothetical protein IKG12_01595 [Candidatus Saccharibacteria bacterium]|nr:hypothetical protein [Candidatus Saccharibacteria bacterium]